MSRWRPSAALAVLQQRSELNAAVRARFARQGVWEVETPTLARSSCLDPQVPSYRVVCGEEQRWLQTSPENHMKRLLAAGSGPIYRLGPVFREGERGRWHGPEFTMLEWYRPGWTDCDLMQDLAELVHELGGPDSYQSSRYADLIAQATGLDMFDCEQGALARCCATKGLQDAESMSRDALLDFLMGVEVGPTLGRDGLQFVTHFPASQAALARLDDDDPRVARRFELYWQGVELANGFYELSDADEQRRRFDDEIDLRRRRNQPSIPRDTDLLDALEHGLPACAGVAVGVDRLYALLLGQSRVDAVQSFAWERA